MSDYKTLAEPVLDDMLGRGKIPIICGGTGFYINSLLLYRYYKRCPFIAIR